MTKGLAGRRIVFVVNDAAMFLRSRAPIARALVDAGASPAVIAPEGPAVEQVRAAGFECRVVPLTRRGVDPLAERRSIAALTRAYGELKPDIVHHFTIKPVIYGGIAARRARVPSVVDTITGLGFVFASRSLRARALRPIVLAGYRLAFRHANTKVIFQNPSDQEAFERGGLLRNVRSALVVGSGIDLERFVPRALPETSVPLVVLPARMLRDKGVLEFVAAAKILHDEGHAVRMALMGDTDDGNPAAIARAQLEAWAQNGSVEWWGWRSDVVAAFHESSIVCLPSYREGSPRALMEAAACARPVVTTDVPGCRDVVRPHETGLVVPARDARALAAAIATLVEDRSLREKFGAAGRALAEREFGIDAVVASTLATYEEMIARAQPREP